MVYWYRSHARLGPRILSTITWSEKAQCTLSSWLTKMYSRKVFSHPLLSSGHFHSHLSLLCSLLQLPSIRLQLLNLRTPSLVSGVTISWDYTRLTLKTSPDEVAHLAKPFCLLSSGWPQPNNKCLQIEFRELFEKLKSVPIVNKPTIIKNKTKALQTRLSY